LWADVAGTGNLVCPLKEILEKQKQILIATGSLKNCRI
jgi:hypothetical protein